MNIRSKDFKANEYVVYPAHGVGQVVNVESQEVGGVILELFVVFFGPPFPDYFIGVEQESYWTPTIDEPESSMSSLQLLT